MSLVEREEQRRSPATPTPAHHCDDTDRRLNDAIHGLRRRFPDCSAATGLPAQQKRWLCGMVFFIMVGFVWDAVGALIILNSAALLYCAALITLRAVLLTIPEHTSSHDNTPLRCTPPYTILIPLYDEANVIDALIASLNALNYPRAKLDIKLILEADDFATRTKVQSLALGPEYDVVVVPFSDPKTKPKACNYALSAARGDYIVIYDAEDRPEPDQLKRAAKIFAAAPDDLICLQARLNYYNPDDNWLTRQFTLEYSTWFRLVLPGLYRFGLPIPLGGTSNHFRTKALQDIGAWDAFNVTEDADLGMRIAAFGYRCGLLPSTTYEEANCRLGNWLRQRSRWQKGFLQTWLTHMRHPGALAQRLGLWGFLSLHLVIGGALFTALAPLVFLIASLGVAATMLLVPDMTYPPVLQIANSIMFVCGYGVALASGWAGLKRARVTRLWPALFTAPAYWSLITLGALKGFAQMDSKPWYWEKTQHGLSHSQRLPYSDVERTDCAAATHMLRFGQTYPTSQSERPQ